MDSRKQHYAILFHKNYTWKKDNLIAHMQDYITFLILWGTTLKKTVWSFYNNIIHFLRQSFEIKMILISIAQHKSLQLISLANFNFTNEPFFILSLLEKAKQKTTPSTSIYC